VAPYAGYEYPGGRTEWGSFEEASTIILNAVEFAKSKHNVDAQQVVIAGYAHGGKPALNTGMRNSNIFCGIIAHSPEFDPWLARPPSEPSTSQPIRVFLSAGDLDGSRKEGIKQAEADYRAAKIPTRVLIYPKQGAEYPKETAELRKALDWALPPRK
jgi:predicted esterase